MELSPPGGSIITSVIQYDPHDQLLIAEGLERER